MVVGFVYLLLNQVIGKLSEEQQKVLETVYRNSEELLELIDNVLWMTSLNAGDANATIEKFDAREVVKETMKRYEKSILEKGLTLNVELGEGELSVVSDRAKVERIFQNIFNNAVKFTAQGGITVSARQSTDGNKVQFEISDTGIGIEESKIDSIFEPFHQADNSMQRAFSGLGLGLTVSRRMTELIGGKLEVTSKPNVGTSSRHDLPLSSSHGGPASD